MDVLVTLAGLVGSVLEFLIGVRTPAQSTPAPSAASLPEAEKRMRWRRYRPEPYESVRLDSERLCDDMPHEFRLLTGNPRAIKQVLSTCGARLMGRAPAAPPGGPWAPMPHAVPQEKVFSIAPPPAAMRRAPRRSSVASRAFGDALVIATLAAVVGGAIALLPRVTPLAPLTGVEIFLAVSVVVLMGLALRALIRRAYDRARGKPDPQA